MTNKREILNLWLGMGGIISGCVLQLAHMYAVGLGLMSVGAYLFYSARTILRRKPDYHNDRDALPPSSQTRRIVTLGVLAFAIFGVPLLSYAKFPLADARFCAALVPIAVVMLCLMRTTKR